MYGRRAPKGELCNKVCMYVCMYVMCLLSLFEALSNQTDTIDNRQPS